MESLTLADKVLIYLLKSYKSNNNSSNASFSAVTKNFCEYVEKS